MANPNISVDVSGNTAKLQQQINQVARKPIVVDVTAGGRGASQPLGRLTGQITEIDKSLAAANARVIAFGAAAGTIFALENAVSSLFKTFVDTEKKLQDINVILNLTDKNLASFGSSLFDIAGNTAQSFDVVAEAATELSRQGLGVEETLKRTEAALILTRLSGLDAAASVSALTAAINSFQNSTLEATEIVNKLANVDAAFAVSSADLANALSRVGSSADDAGISFDELIALVTTAQQITARGGSVIGNSLKTIFTRLGRGKVQEVLGGLGISATDEQGQVKNQVQLLKELAAVYDTLSSTQKNYVAEQVGGVFQINILKAALGDLGKEYSIYDRALKTSLSSTDQAIQRNEQLNQTLSALGSQTLANVQKAASSIGEGLFSDASRNVLNATNFLAEGVSNADAESIGGQIGKGVIDGLSKFISGPGLALATGVIVKLLADFARYGAEAFQSILGTNTAAKEQAVVQQNIAKFLQNNSSLYNSILNGQVSVSSAAKEYLAVIQQQTAALQKQNSIAASISQNLTGSVGIRTIAGQQFVSSTKKSKTAAGGYFPEAIEQANINARIGGANPATDRPVTIPNFAFGGGKRGAITAHTGEWAIPNFAGSGGTAIFNKDMKKKYGLPNGARKIFASGFIPNFAKTKLPPNISLEEAIQSNQYSRSQLSQRFTAPVVNSRLGPAKKPSLEQSSSRAIDLGNTSTLSLIYGEKAGIKNETGFFNTDKNGFITDKKISGGKTYKVGFKSSGYNAKVKPEDAQLEKLLGDQIIDFTNRFISIFGNYSPNARIKSVQQLANYGSFRSIAGNIFESAVTQATDSAVTQAGRSGGSSAIIDFVSPNDKLRKLFNNIPGDYEAKIGNQQNLVNDVARKAFISNKLKVKSGQLSRSKASGFIPNFANTNTNKGIPISKIRAHFDSAGNPIAVTNTGDEPNGLKSLKDAVGREKRGIGTFSNGFIPNFAIEQDASESEGSLSKITKALGASALEIALFASIGASQNKLNEQNLKELQSTNKKRNSLDRNNLAREIKQARSEARLRTTGGLPSRQEALSNIRAGFGPELERQRGAIAPGGLQKQIARVGKFRPGLGAAFIAPVIAETIANAIPQETQGGRAGASAVSGVGQIASFASIGALAGPKGAAAGALVGTIVAVTDVLNQFKSNLPELNAEVSNIQDAFARNTENIQGLQSAYSKYEQLLESGASQNEINEAQKKYLEFLTKFNPSDAKNFLAGIKSSGSAGIQQVGEKILTPQAETISAAERSAGLESVFKNIRNKDILDVAFGSAGTFKEANKEQLNALNELAKSGIIQNKTGEALKKRVQELGGLEKIEENFSLLLSEVFNLNIEDIIAIKQSPEFEKQIQEVLKNGLQESLDLANITTPEINSQPAKENVNNKLNEITKEILDGINLDLTYDPKTSALKGLEDQFFQGDISREQFIGQRSKERLDFAAQLGLKPSGIDVQNVANLFGNLKAQEAADLGFGKGVQDRARSIAASKVASDYKIENAAPENLMNTFLNDLKNLIDKGDITPETATSMYQGAKESSNLTTSIEDLRKNLSGVGVQAQSSSVDQNFASAESASSSMRSNMEEMVSLTNVMVETVGKFVSARTEAGNFVPEGRAEPFLVDNGPPVFNINQTPIAISFTSEGSTVLADLDVKLTAEKQRILDEVAGRLQLIKAQNNLK
jgi:TP901 family phage tail tape measure protein